MYHARSVKNPYFRTAREVIASQVCMTISTLATPRSFSQKDLAFATDFRRALERRDHSRAL